MSGQTAAARRAILFVLGAAAVFAVAAGCVKALDGAIPIAQLIVFRNLAALPLLWPLIRAAGGLSVLRTSRPFDHLQRCAWGLLGMTGAFYGYTHLPLALVTALGFTMPLFLTALSVPLLGERVGWRRWTAVAVGFLGVLLMVRPGAADEVRDPLAVGLVLASAVGWAMAMITIRRMGERGEPGVSIVAWFAIGSGLAATVFAIPVWVWPDALQLFLLVLIGLISAAAQILMTEAYRRSEATLLAPFEYSGILWTAGIGAIFWAEYVDAWDLAGIAVLVGSGLFIWRREAGGRG